MIYFKDPKGNIMKQMINVTSGQYGIVEGSMIMDDEPVLGPWHITVKAHSHYLDNSYYAQTVKIMSQRFTPAQRTMKDGV